MNGIRMYYEIHGQQDGVPLVLLHGGGSTIDSTFGEILPFLAEGRRVIAIEEQAHGRTTDRDQPVRFETSADDVAALLRHLDVERSDLFGFSNGASVALHVALRHPELVRKLVFASSFTKRNGARPELWTFLEQGDFSTMPQALKDAFLAVNPDPEALRTMHDKDLERMLTFSDVSDDALRSIRATTLILVGDQDVVRPIHAVELSQLIPDSRLLILPGGHGDYLGEVTTAGSETRYPELTASLVEHFLSASGDDAVRTDVLTLLSKGEACTTSGARQCEEGLFCSSPIGQCLREEAIGICATKPDICTDEYAPVCGCNGRTYGNACEADAAAVSIRHVGTCD